MGKVSSERRGYQPMRVGENVANELRDRILAGEYTGRLPKQEALMDVFGVSAPSVREAFRVLEAEGLIIVRRGNVGGAEIRLPNADDTAYALGLVLQSEGSLLVEVSDALWAFEPMVARKCAERHDRLTVIVPRLREMVQAAEDQIDEPNWEYEFAQSFHDELGKLCGNRAMSAMCAGLYSLYHSHLDEWTETHGSYATRSQRESIIREHRELVELIADGDAKSAENLERAHLQTWMKPLLDEKEIVSVTVPRDRVSRRR